jgi:putative phosphoribosyl transferase
VEFESRAIYEDRVEGGRALVPRLEEYRTMHPLVLGIPRGGVPVAAEVARALGAELDIVVARKLGAPHQPELAIGAVTANGGRYLNDLLIRELAVSDAYLAAETARKLTEARNREEHMRGGLPKIPIEGRIVIVVDDGLATGATIRAAVRSVRAAGAARVVVAVPVGAPESCIELEREVDRLICPERPAPFFAVGFFYERFEPTREDEVKSILREVRQEGVAR